MVEPPPRCKFPVIFIIIISLCFGQVSFILCIVAEVKRNKQDDLTWNGKLCQVPLSPAFGLGIAALVCFSFAQIIGNVLFLKSSSSAGKAKAVPKIAKVLYLISWISFGFAVILLLAATSMSRKQPYGVGWLNGECYLVKGGIYAGSGILILFTIGSITCSSFTTIKTSQTVRDSRIYAPFE